MTRDVYSACTAHAVPLQLSFVPATYRSDISASIVYNFVGLIALRISCRASKHSPTIWSRWSSEEWPTQIEPNDQLHYEMRWASKGHLGVVFDIGFSNNRTLLESPAKSELLNWGGVSVDRGLWPGVEWPAESAQIGKHVSYKWAAHSLKLPSQFVGHSVVALLFSCSPEYSLRGQSVQAALRNVRVTDANGKARFHLLPERSESRENL